ncbi:S26 family signal peptidase [Acidocella sp.]|uniref:S26 family signal peptidase n=1 Tax=Acidocella sp. TaxID=50710 RepID=UPI00261AAF67|nr:S26 family signal peptidase [Acidocella sp.]
MRSRARRYRVRQRRRTLVAAMVLGLGLIGGSAIISPAPLLIYNASASAPLGFYVVLPKKTFRRGDLLLVKTPESVKYLAAERHYLPLNVDLVKRIAAVQGDQVCAIDGVVSIDGTDVARQLQADRKGRPLPRWSGCQMMGSGELFFLMQGVPDSFDSRYFGPVSTRAVIGRLVPIWLR